MTDTIERIINFREWNSEDQQDGGAYPYRTHLLRYTGPKPRSYREVVNNTLDRFLVANPQMVAEMRRDYEEVTLRNAINQITNDDWRKHSSGTLQEITIHPDYEIVDLFTDRDEGEGYPPEDEEATE